MFYLKSVDSFYGVLVYKSYRITRFMMFRRKEKI